jgi:hypothetical protein
VCVVTAEVMGPPQLPRARAPRRLAGPPAPRVRPMGASGAPNTTWNFAREVLKKLHFCQRQISTSVARVAAVRFLVGMMGSGQSAGIW